MFFNWCERKRAQITVFVILGIVIVVVFLFLLNISSQMQTVKLQKQVENQLSDVSNSRSLNHYIQLCLKQSGEDAINTLSLQGGVIYDYQGGATPVDTTFPIEYMNDDGTKTNISYGITAPILRSPSSPGLPFTVSTVPCYPRFIGIDYPFCLGYINLNTNYNLGDLKLPYLCDINGFNSIDLNFTGYVCRDNGNGKYSKNNDSNVIQIQLANYTSKLMKECVDPTYIKNTFGKNVIFGEPNTILTLGEREVTFQVNFPIYVTAYSNSTFGRKSYTGKNITSFQTRVPVRLKRDYDFILDVLENDKKNLTFNITNDYQYLQTYKNINNTNKHGQEVEFSVIKDPITNINFLQMTDYGSIIQGKPYVFRTLIENRIPILDYRRQTGVNQEMDIYAIIGQKIEIKPKGYEPDDEDMFFRYFGWQESESYNFDMLCCNNQGRSPLCLNDVSNGGCVTKTNIGPYEWTRSSDYISNLKDASYVVENKDIGMHNLTVYVCDRYGLFSDWVTYCDWQNVSIYVYPTPILKISGHNQNFTDINYTHASIEDNYYLEASTALDIMPTTTPQGLIFQWCDNKDFECIELENPILELPNESFNIENIIEKKYRFNTTGDHIINLSTGINNSRLTLNANLNLTVSQCLPHRSSSLPDLAPPYPFNNFSIADFGMLKYTIHTENPFEADHACCEDNYNFSLKGTTCYNFTTYGGFWSFNDTIFTSLKTNRTDFSNYDVTWELADGTSNNVTIGTSYLNDYTNNYANDVYKRYFVTECSGERGNICDDNPHEIREAIKCDDDIAQSQTEKCSGPNKFLINENETALSCINYVSGESFEKGLSENNIFNFGNPDDADGECDENYQCVNNNFLAKGTCNGNGQCTHQIVNLYWDTTIDCRCSEGIANNTATVVKFDVNNNGSCTTGYIDTCDATNPAQHKCARDNTKSKITYNNSFSKNGQDYVFNEYILDKNNDACGETQNWCKLTNNINPDGNENLCLLFKNQVDNTVYYNNLHKDANRKCCGDDDKENGIPTKALGSVSNKLVNNLLTGCKLNGDCYYNNTAYGVGFSYIISGSDKDYCFNGNWVDCKTDSDCNASEWCITNNNDDNDDNLHGNKGNIYDCVVKRKNININQKESCERDEQCEHGCDKSNPANKVCKDN